MGNKTFEIPVWGENLADNWGGRWGKPMVHTGVLLGLYCCVWVIVSVALHAAGRRFMDAASPAPHRLLVSVVGGAVWPLVLIGVFEISSFVAYTKVQNRTSTEVGILV